MRQTDVLFFRGTGEVRNPNGYPTGMLSTVAKELDPGYFRCWEPEWPASIGPIGSSGPMGPSMHASRGIAATQIAKYIKLNGSRPVGLVGYSLGALGVSQFLENLNAGHYENLGIRQEQVSFVCNISNPARRRGECFNGLVPDTLFGLYGEHPPWPNIGESRVMEFASPQDIITSSPWDSPVRKISDVIDPFSFLESAHFGDPIAQLKRNRQVQQYYKFWDPRFWTRYSEALQGVGGYLAPYPLGTHTMYNVRNFPGRDHSWCTEAGKQIMQRYAR